MNITDSIDKLALKSDDISDYLLPSAVNESKQMVNGKVFSSVYLIGAVCFSFIAIFLYAIPSGNDTGPGGFMAFSAIMDAGLILIIPMMLYQNMTSERSNGSFELMAITSITPLKIVLGKWQSGMMQAFVFGSIVLPGIIYCYFFNGIAISAIFVSAIFTLLASQFAILFSIFLCSLGTLKRSRLTLQFISTIANVIIFCIVMGIKFDMVDRDRLLADILSWDFFVNFLIFLYFILLIETFLISISTAQLSTYSENKSTIPRIIYSLLILSICISFFFLGFHYDMEEFIMLIVTVHFIISFFFFMEKDVLSRKVYLKMIKKEFILKSIFKKFFYPGKSSAYLLFVVQTCLLWLSFYFYFVNNSTKTSYSYRSFDVITISYIMSCILFYASCVYLTFCLVLKIFPHAKVGVLCFSGIFIMVIIILCPIIPYINSENEEFWMIMNIIYILNNGLDGYIFGNLLITASTMLVSCLIAAFSNNRSEETVRDFVAGERGAT